MKKAQNVSNENLIYFNAHDDFQYFDSSFH